MPQNHGFHPFGGRISKRFGDSLAPEDAYLSYYDVRLTKEDVDCIKHDWLTDNAIAFYEEYLERERLPKYPNAHICLLRPSMCFMLMQTPDPLTLKDALPNFSQTTHIFLPVNDCRSVTTPEGGSHWSLLLVSLIDGVSFHYDSLRPANQPYAEHASRKLSMLLGRHLQFIELADSPRQDGGSDCGVFVCLTMKYLLMKRLLTSDSSAQVSMSMGGMMIDAHKGRKDILQMIEKLREQGRRSQSRSRSPWGRASVDRKSPPRVGD